MSKNGLQVLDGLTNMPPALLSLHQLGMQTISKEHTHFFTRRRSSCKQTSNVLSLSLLNSSTVTHWESGDPLRMGGMPWGLMEHGGTEGTCRQCMMICKSQARKRRILTNIPRWYRGIQSSDGKRGGEGPPKVFIPYLSRATSVSSVHATSAASLPGCCPSCSSLDLMEARINPTDGSLPPKCRRIQESC